MSKDFSYTFAMVMVQVGFAGLNIFSKLALDTGMNPFIMVAYRQIIATIFMGPFSYFWERKTRAKLTKMITFQIFFCSIFGATLNQCLYFVGLKYTSPTMGCALNNLLPAITFIMAVLFKLERLEMKKLGGLAKIIGTLICVGGAMAMTFYKGKVVKMWESGLHWRYAERLDSNTSGGEDHMLLGSSLVVASCFAWAIWFILQAKMSKEFTSPYSSSSLMSGMASVQCTIIALCVERDFSAWALGWDIRLVAAVYSGVVISGISFALMTWCIQRKGPLFVSMFSPLLLVIVAIFGWAALDEKLNVGSVLGSALIVGGLYAVLWGKGKEQGIDGVEGRSSKEEEQAYKEKEEEEKEEEGRVELVKIAEKLKNGNGGNNIPSPHHSIDFSRFGRGEQN